VLEAPSIQDDFYLNLIDWGSQNVLSVGLGASVYLWNAHTAQVSLLMGLPEGDSVASLSWAERGPLLAIGTGSGSLLVWDAQAGKEVAFFFHHHHHHHHLV
jgi:cell division cycle 20-like protein 1 (cofactor of APC complex)